MSPVTDLRCPRYRLIPHMMALSFLQFNLRYAPHLVLDRKVPLRLERQNQADI